MPDFRDRLMGGPYYGPTDSTMLEVITSFKSRNSCSYEELLHTFGTINKKRLDDQLVRMVKEKKLVEEIYFNQLKRFRVPQGVE